jgi:hypothetical protein
MLAARSSRCRSWSRNTRKGCPLTYTVGSSDEVEFRYGSQRDGFEFGYDAEALRQFVTLAGAALKEMDALLDDEAKEPSA